MVLGKVYLSGKEGVPKAEAFASAVILILVPGSGLPSAMA